MTRWFGTILICCVIAAPLSAIGQKAKASRPARATPAKNAPAATETPEAAPAAVASPAPAAESTPAAAAKREVVTARGTVSFTRSLDDRTVETARFSGFDGRRWNLCGKHEGADIRFEIRPDKMAKIEFLDEVKYGPERGSIRVTARANGSTFTLADAVVCRTDGVWDSTLELLIPDPLGGDYHPVEVKLFDHFIRSIAFE